MLSCRFLGLALITASAVAADSRPAHRSEAIAVLRAVGPEGQGNEAAAAAWRLLIGQDVACLPEILKGMKDANALARNWLRAAGEVITSRDPAARGALPVRELTDILDDRSQDPQARWLAYQWILRQDPSRRRALAGAMLDDPATALRREAVDELLHQAAASEVPNRDAAIARYRTALNAAREVDQIEAAAKALRGLGESVNLITQFGWVTAWKIIGPFDNTAQAGFERVFPPETEVRLDAEYDGKSGKVSWHDFEATDEYGKVDFNKALAAAKEVTGFAFSEFHSDRERPAELRLGCKNGWKLWWNGQFVFGRDEYHRGAEIDQYRLPVRVRPGRNTILVKLCQNEEVEEWTVEWEFQLRITDPAGTPLRSIDPRPLQPDRP